MTLRFGTDGVRGPAAEFGDDLVHALGRAAARVLAPAATRHSDATFVIGRDTRESGNRLETALASGVASEHLHVDHLGVAPTPAVAWVAAARGAPAAMISASHNPYADNGIKFFAPGGRKLSDAVEAELEAELDRLIAAGSAEGPVAEGPGRAPDTVGMPHGDGRGREVHADVERYGLAVAASLEGRTLAGLRVVLDCANGAASWIAPLVLRRLGAEVEVIHDRPDGRNINESCGSTHPDDLRAKVIEARASAGLAFDGDADRVLAVDERGGLVDGDRVIAICALDRHSRGRLAGGSVVVTVMTNLGFRLSMEEAGIAVVETAVGDRNVLEVIEQGGFDLGGEQSGHVIFRDLATTGDGLLTGVQLLDVMARTGESLAALADRSMTPVPQVMRNVRLAAGRAGSEVVGAVAQLVESVESELAGSGRVLVRPSGTEPLVRVMVEAREADRAEAAADRVAAAVEQAANL